MEKEKAEKIIKIYNWVRFIILVLFLTFVFIGLSKAQTTNDFGKWVSVGAEKNVNDSWGLGVSTELRTKDNTGSVDRWQLGVSGTYKVCKVMKLGGGYEFHMKNRTVDDGTETVPRHRLMFDITPGGKVSDWLKLSLRERYQYTYMMQNGRSSERHDARINGRVVTDEGKAKGNVDASHEHPLRNRFKAEITNSKMIG